MTNRRFHCSSTQCAIRSLSAAGQSDWKFRIIGSGASLRPKCEELVKAAPRRELDRIVVWRLDRWGGSLIDLVSTLQELASLKVGFVTLSEALDLTTPSGRSLAGVLAMFTEFERDILRDRVKAAIAQTRKEGRPHGRPPTVAKYTLRVRALAKNVLSKSEISRRLRISRTSVIRFLGQAELTRQNSAKSRANQIAPVAGRAGCLLRRPK